MKKDVFALYSVIVIVCGLFFWSCASPQNAIRTDLVFKGHLNEAFQVQIYKADVDKQYGQRYLCRNISAGPDFYSFHRVLGLWFINTSGTGGA